MKRLLLLVATTLLGHYCSSAQDGKLISREDMVFADSTVAKMRKAFPDAGSVAEHISFSKITYLSDGLKVKGFVATPKKPGKYPCIIFNRGGNRDFGAINERTLFRFFGTVASWGYIVVGSQYRGNDGGEGKEEFGGKDVNDVVNLIPLLSKIDKADTSRIGMYGWSRGGMMTYSALTKTNRIKAAIIGSGMANSFNTVNERADMENEVYAELVPHYKADREAALKARSAVYFADKMSKTTPLLIMHGSSDWRVSPEQAFEMTRKLYDNKHPFRFVMFEGGDHSLMEHYEEVNRLAKNFLDKYVRDGQAWPSMESHGD
jgi:dipeptidyl aminopeptidase/acylaminoacyl peptidase